MSHFTCLFLRAEVFTDEQHKLTCTSLREADDAQRDVRQVDQSGGVGCSARETLVHATHQHERDQLTRLAHVQLDLVSRKHACAKLQPRLVFVTLSITVVSSINACLAGHVGAGSNAAIAAAAARAIGATAEMSQGRRTSSLKNSYEAIKNVDMNQGLRPYALSSATARADAGPSQSSAHKTSRKKSALKYFHLSYERTN